MHLRGHKSFLGGGTAASVSEYGSLQRASLFSESTQFEPYQQPHRRTVFQPIGAVYSLTEYVVLPHVRFQRVGGSILIRIRRFLTSVSETDRKIYLGHADRHL